MFPATSADEIIDVFVAGKSPEQIDAFRPAKQTRDRISWLLSQAGEDSLGTEERSELEDYLQLEHRMILARARARRQSDR